MIRYIPGTDPLDERRYRLSDTERADLLARVRAATTPRRIAAARATAARWEQHRASQPPERPTAGLLVSQHMHVTNPGRVAARYAMLANCTLTTAVWHLHDLGVDVSSRTVSKRWCEIYPGVPAGVLRRARKPEASTPSAPGHAIRIASYVSPTWIEDDGHPARVVRWICSCGRRGGEFHHGGSARCLGGAAAHIKAALRHTR